MKKIVLGLALALMAAAPGLWAGVAPQPETPPNAPDLIKAGDEAYARFDDAGALALYEQAAKLEPSNYEALWKTARAYMNVGDRVDHRDKDHEQKMLGYFLVAERYLTRALAVDPNDSQTHFLKAAILGREARSASRSQQVDLAYTIKAEIDKALALDPRNDLAWHALAYWNRTLADVGGFSRFFGSILFGRIPQGSYEEAVKDFQKAIALNPKYCNHHIELARTYLRLEKKDLAAKEYAVALDCPNLSSMCAHFKERAKRELETLKSGGEIHEWR